MDKLNEILEELRNIARYGTDGGDEEDDHHRADALLCNALREMANCDDLIWKREEIALEILAAWDSIGKFYA